jgi:hypothetical protein
MAFVSPNMSLKVWNSSQDSYDHEQLADNFLKLDQHNHTMGQGAQIPTGGIADGSITVAKLAGDTLSAIGTGIPTVTSLPGSPVDGQQVYFIADNTKGVIWHLRYRAASSSAFKWEFVGGPPIRNGLGSVVKVATTAYAQMSLAISLVAPLSGDYEVQLTGNRIQNNAVGVAVYAYLVSTGAGDATGDNDMAYALIGQFQSAPLAVRSALTGVTGGNTIDANVAHGDITSSVSYKGLRLTATPVRVG